MIKLKVKRVETLYQQYCSSLAFETTSLETTIPNKYNYFFLFYLFIIEFIQKAR